MKKLILFTALLFSVLLIYGQRDVQGDRVIAHDSIYINGEWIYINSGVDDQIIKRVNGRWINSSGSNSDLDTISGSSYITVQDWMNVTQSAGIITGGVITDDLDGTVTVSSGSGIVKKTNSEIGANEIFDFAADATLTLTDESINYIYLDYNSGVPVMGNSTTNTANGRTRFNLGKLFKEGTHIDIINSGLAIYDITKRNQQRIKETYGFQFVSGAVVAEVGTRQISMTAGIMYAGNNRITTDAINTSTGDDFEYYYYDGTDWQETDATAIDNLQYNDITTGLATLSNNQHGVHWVYKGTEDHSYVIYGQESYTLVAAQASQPPVSLPSHVEEMGVLRAKIIIEKNGAVFEEIESVADITFSSSAASDHNELTGLDGGEAGYYGHLTNIEKLRVSNFQDSVQANVPLGDAGEVGFTNTSGNGLSFTSLFKYNAALGRLELAQLDFDYLYNNAGDLVASLPASTLPTLRVENTLGFTGRTSSVTTVGNMYLDSDSSRWVGNTGDGVKAFLMTGDATAATWGSITGTLSNQTDLQDSLNAKLDTADFDTSPLYTAHEVDSLLALQVSISGASSSTFYTGEPFKIFRGDSVFSFIPSDTALATKTLISSHLTTDVTRIIGSTGGYTVGNGFSVTSTGTLNSIEVQMNCSSDETVILRIGTSANLTTYTEEISQTVNTSGAYDWVSFDSVDLPTLTAGTYYFMLYSSTGTTEPIVRAEDAQAITVESYYFATQGTWVGANVDTRRLVYRVYQNQ